MKSILTLLLLCPLTCIFSQTDISGFPLSWEGKWGGTLEIFRDTGKVNELQMELHILSSDTLPVDTYTWTIIYGEDKIAGRQPYTLVTVDADKGIYLIDERNSIVMEGYFLAGKFYQFFDVMGSRLLTTTELRDESLIWEIMVSSDEPVSTTGGQQLEGEEIPPVLTFPVNGVQRAVLRRQ